MTAARQNAIGITLPGGKVFVTDGITADLYDPKSATFSATTSPNFANSPIRALLLKTRKVLLTDGTTAKLFDPSNGAIAPTGSLKVTRTEFTATLLNNGKVLVAGGCCDSNGALSSAELYDPSSGMFALTGSMTHPRFNHVAAVVGGSKAKGGDALIVGGSAFTPPPGGPNLDVAGADLYNPATGKFTFIAPDPSTNQPRYGFGATATTLSDGRVLIAGGEDTNDGGGAFDLPTLYDPSTGTFANAGNMVNPRDFHSATLLKNGQVLIAGGDNGSFPHPGCCSTLSGAELFSSHRHKGH
jgi:hypothetical protein